MKIFIKTLMDETTYTNHPPTSYGDLISYARSLGIGGGMNFKVRCTNTLCSKYGGISYQHKGYHKFDLKKKTKAPCELCGNSSKIIEYLLWWCNWSSKCITNDGKEEHQGEGETCGNQYVEVFIQDKHEWKSFIVNVVAHCTWL